MSTVYRPLSTVHCQLPIDRLTTTYCLLCTHLSGRKGHESQGEGLGDPLARSPGPRVLELLQLVREQTLATTVVVGEA